MAHPDIFVNTIYHDRSSNRQRWINGNKLRLVTLISAIAALATIVSILGGDREHTDALDQDRREARYIVGQTVGQRSTAPTTSRDDIRDPNQVKLSEVLTRLGCRSILTEALIDLNAEIHSF